MNLRSHFAQGFDYDLWATEQWKEVTPWLPCRDRAEEIISHIEDVLLMWRGRWEASQGRPVPETVEGHAAIVAYWQSVAQSEDLEAQFEWIRRRDGISRTAHLKDVLAHLVLHGTYHRGQIRGLCDADDFSEFPDTDFAKWVANPASAESNHDGSFLRLRMQHDLWGWMAMANAWRMRDDLSPGFIEKAERVLGHACWCPGRWGESVATQWGLNPPPTGGTLDALAASYEWWSETLASAGPDRVSERRNAAGELVERTCESVVTHITNHGHYHRGHVRGLAEREGWDDFPDTDFVFFADPSRVPG